MEEPGGLDNSQSINLRVVGKIGRLENGQNAIEKAMVYCQKYQSNIHKCPG